jgi:hypothetical protein
MDPTPIPTPPIQPPSPAVVPNGVGMKEGPVLPKSKNWLVILLIFFVVILSFGTAAYFAYQNVQLKKQVTKISPTSPNPLSSPTPTTDPTVNWKTYTNSVFNYSFKYPLAWSVGTKGQADASTATGIIISNPCSYDNGDLCQQIMLTAEKSANKNDVTPDFILNQNDVISEKNTSSVSEATVYSFADYQKNYGTSGRLLFVAVMNNGTVKFTITYEESQKRKTFISPNDWQGKPTFDQILSTFKFLSINPTSSETTVPSAKLVSIVGWNKSSALTFSVLYPPEYSPFSSGDMINFRHTQNPEQVAVINISRDGDPQTAKPYSVYTGQSRRAWWIKSQYDAEHPQPANLRFVEKMLGTIDGLEVYIGDSLQTILVTHGDKLYQIGGQNDIINIPTLETITSTLTFQ